MSRRITRRRGRRRSSAAVAVLLTPSSSNANNTDYSFPGRDLGADAPDRMYVVDVTVRLSATTELTSVSLGGFALTKVDSVNGNSINFSRWYLPAGVMPTGASAELLVTSGASRSMCHCAVRRITGQRSSTPYWSRSVLNAGSGTSLDLSPASAGPADGATVTGSAAPGSGATYTWSGVTEDYDAATESTDCRVSGGSGIGLPASVTATVSSSVTNLMGIATHWR